MVNRLPIKAAIDGLTEIAMDERLRERFDLGFWGNRLDVHAHNVPEDPSCGFAGCYIGWAIHQQWFAPFGLVLRLTSCAEECSDTAALLAQSFPIVDKSSSKIFQRFTRDPGLSSSVTDGAIAAVAYLFGVSTVVMERLIYEDHYDEGDHAGPSDVAAKLQFLLDHGADDFLAHDIKAQELRDQDRS